MKQALIDTALSCRLLMRKYRFMVENGAAFACGLGVAMGISYSLDQWIATI
jgi:hypothetical protein